MSALVLFEDEHLLVVNKPAGINTHKPDRFTLDGLHEWLTKREQRWAHIAILHRLDKETSGVMVFGKTRRANQALAKQFESHRIEKNYLLLSDARPTRGRFRARSQGAETEFERLPPHGRFHLIRARPVTGKTHQVRRHAAENGFPILGDTEYGGASAPRLMLHAHTIAFAHPTTGGRVVFEASVPEAFDTMDALVAAKEFRELLFDEETNAYRLIADEVDGFAEVLVDSYAGRLLAQWQTDRVKADTLYEQLIGSCAPVAIYEQIATKQKRSQPRRVWSRGEDEAERFPICEHGLKFLVGFGHGLATGIFLDQRENRRRLLRSELAGRSVLNGFSYTCAFSVAAARAGAMTTSIDLSSRYLDWGKENFRANQIDPGTHEFLVGNVFEWIKRFARHERRWDVVILDPPTFSTTKRGRAFQAARDYLQLQTVAMPLVASGGTLFCSTNQRTVTPEKFEATVRQAARDSGRTIKSVEFETQPFDFRVAAGERPYLKTLWVELAD